MEWVLHKDELARNSWSKARQISLKSGYKPVEVILNVFIGLLDGEAGFQSKAIKALRISEIEWTSLGLDPKVLIIIKDMLKAVETGDFPQ